jgi:hypothetical protein
MKIEKLDGVFVETFTTTCASPLGILGMGSEASTS